MRWPLKKCQTKSGSGPRLFWGLVYFGVRVRVSLGGPFRVRGRGRGRGRINGSLSNVTSVVASQLLLTRPLWHHVFPSFRFLYQVFPGTTLQCQRLLFKAAKTGELDTVQKLVSTSTMQYGRDKSVRVFLPFSVLISGCLFSKSQGLC